MANVMYYAWTRHGIMPSTIYNLSRDELEIISALCLIDLSRKQGGVR